MSLSKHKATANYCPGGLLVKLRTFQAEHPSSNPICGNFYFFPKPFSLQTDTQNVCVIVFELYRMFLCDQNWRQNNTKVSDCYNLHVVQQIVFWVSKDIIAQLNPTTINGYTFYQHYFYFLVKAH